MKAPLNAALLRLYTDEDAMSGDRSLFEEIVKRARGAGLAGATVLRGRMGYGASAHLHQQRPFDLSQNLPVVIELVDEEARLRAFLETLTDLHDVGLVTLEKVEVLRYGGAAAEAAPRD